MYKPFDRQNKAKLYTLLMDQGVEARVDSDSHPDWSEVLEEVAEKIDALIEVMDREAYAHQQFYWCKDWKADLPIYTLEEMDLDEPFDPKVAIQLLDSFYALAKEHPAEEESHFKRIEAIIYRALKHGYNIKMGPADTGYCFKEVVPHDEEVEEVPGMAEALAAVQSQLNIKLND